MRKDASVKILLVDDNQDNLLTLEAILGSEDVELIMARSGPEALEALLVHEVALALVDVQMPHMDGFELAQLMRGTEKTRQIPIVFVTAGSHDTRRVFDGYAAGAVDFLYKPVETHVIQSKVDVFVQLYLQKRQLSAKLEELRQMLRMNELLTAAIGHDLRNPLNSMVMGAAFLARSSQEEDTRHTANGIHNSGKRMAKLISDLLDFSSLRLNGSLPVAPAETALPDVARKVIAELQLADPSANIEMTLSGNLKAVWDQSRIEQALSNLIGNALVHGDRSESIKVNLDGSQPDTVTISVHNKGAIPPSILPYMFDPFHSSSHRSSGASGLGLGLYIVEQIVHTHHGKINVHSTADEGTTFVICLPRTGRLNACETSQSISV